MNNEIMNAIRSECFKIRKFMKNEDKYFDVVSFLEFDLSTYINEKVNLIILADDENEIMDENFLAYTCYLNNDLYVYLRESVYENAIKDSSAAAARPRFTIAHEIAHVILHRKILKENSTLKAARPLDNKNYSYYYKNSPLIKEKIILIENEADFFAGSLLVPEINAKKMKIMEMRYLFGVSEQAARVIKKQASSIT